MSTFSAADKELYRKLFVLLFLVIIVLAFFFLIRNLIITVVLSATFSGLLYPFCNRLERALGGRRVPASLIVILSALVIVGGPLLGMLIVAAKEALQISESLMPWVQAQMSTPMDQWMRFFEWVPFIEELKPYQSNIFEGLSQLLQMIGAYMTKMFSAATLSTVDFFFKTFVGVYSAFFFLNDGERMLKSLIKLVPLTDEEMRQMTQKGLRIIRATIRSLFVIGAIQGTLVGLAFWVLGLKGAVFWGIVVMVLAAIPGLGAPIVWVPTVGYLVFSDRLMAGVGLALWGVLVVGLVDNFLRPRIIGQDAQVPDLLILLSILGGLSAFGVAGLILGPILVSVLISALEIYSRVFSKTLSAPR